MYKNQVQLNIRKKVPERKACKYTKEHLPNISQMLKRGLLLVITLAASTLNYIIYRNEAIFKISFF
jgi:hypothetical protein